MKYKQHQHGFHLIEILITLSLIAIMSNMMIGQFHHFTYEAHRREAVMALHTLASAMETYAIEQSSYAGATFTKLKIYPQVADGNYLLIINNAHADEYLISARPLSRQADNDKRCGTLLLSSTGKISVTGTASAAECFNT